MNKKNFLILLGTLIFVLPFLSLANSNTTYAEPEDIAANVENLVVTIGTVIVVIGWVIAGILYLTAAGDPQKIGTAKKAMIASLIGTILIIIAEGGYNIIKSIIEPVLQRPPSQ